MHESLPKSAAVVLSVMALAGCAGGRWFQAERPNTSPSSDTSNDPRAASAAYIRSLCALPSEQRQRQVRSLNEAVLPDNVTLSCGRSGLQTE